MSFAATIVTTFLCTSCFIRADNYLKKDQITIIITDCNTTLFARTIVSITVVSFETSTTLNTLCTTVTVCITSLATTTNWSRLFSKSNSQAILARTAATITWTSTLLATTRTTIATATKIFTYLKLQKELKQSIIIGLNIPSQSQKLGLAL